MSVPDAEVARILSALGMHVEVTSEGWQVKPPSVDLKLNGGPSGRGKGPASINLVEVQELW